MKPSSTAILTLLLFISNSSATKKCPFDCSCSLDHRGRNLVVCNKGGMIGPIDLNQLHESTEVLRITAPEDNMNILTIGPAFQNFKNLEEIHITRSNIPILGSHFFYGLKKLEVLNLSQNNISQLLDVNFLGLTNLRELVLDDNRIFSMPSGTFRYLHNMKVLSLQRNRLRELVPRIFLEVGKLRKLRLSGNNLRELNPEVFKDVQELQELECRGCSLKKIDDMFHLLPQLIHLDLGHNEIRILAADEFQNLQKLRVLKLDSNRITMILSDTFALQTNLVTLNLAKNEISRIDPNAFRMLHNLSELDLSYNNIKELDQKVFYSLSENLRKLVLSGNCVDPFNLKLALKNLKVEKLFLSEMGIMELPPEAFPDTVKLLRLDGNYLTTLSPSNLPPNLNDLDISRNRLKGLEENVVRRLDSIEKYKLHSNPWSCDLCHITPMLDRVNTSARMAEVRCVAPYTVDGKLLGSIQRSDLTWCNSESGDVNYFLTTEENSLGLIAAGASVLLVSLTVMAILGAVCYSRRHAAKYYTHEDKLSGERDSIFENSSPLFEDKELSFKFPLTDEKRISISTIDQIKKEHSIMVNGN